MTGPSENKAIDPELGRRLETKAMRRTIASTRNKFAQRWGFKAGPAGGTFAPWASSVPGAGLPVTRAELLEAFDTLERLLELLP